LNRTRFITLVALGFVLYIAASAGAEGVHFELGQVFALLVALALSFTPAWAREGEPSDAPARVGLVGVALSLSLSAWVARSLFALVGEIFLAVLLPVGAVTLIELAVTAPDVPPRLVRQVRSLSVVRWLGGGVGLLGVVAALPPLWLFGRALIAPSWVAAAPAVFAVSGLCLATLLRLARRRFGSDARAMASNQWPATGLSVAALLLGLSVVIVERHADAGSVDACAALAAFVMAAGHVWLVSPVRALTAGPLGRAWLATALALVVSVAGGLALHDVWPADPVLRAAGLGLVLLGFAGLRALLLRVVERWVAPDAGRLLRAIDEAERDLTASQSLDDLAARVLRPLRRAALVPEAAPMLFTSHPMREFRLDAAGQPQESPRALPAALTRQFQRAGLLTLVREDLSSLLVRRPELRDVLQALDGAGALLALPLVTEGELEGVLLVARGARTSPLTLEELSRLERLGRSLSALITVFSARARAFTRAEEAARHADLLAARVDELSYDLEHVRAQFHAVAAGLAREPAHGQGVAYSAAMRALNERLEHVAPHALPVALITEVGVSGLAQAELMHAASGRQALPFVTMACGAAKPDEAVSVLFGDRTTKPYRPGVLELAGAGTLFLGDVVALPIDVQRSLARALAEHRASALGSESSFEVHARLIATLRAPVAELVVAGTLAPELARWFEPTGYRVPALRERAEDLESLVMIAVDRAARVLGRAVPGLTPEALRALAEYTWPGNLDELESVVSRAVLACRGPRITLSDLPPLPVPGAVNAGSFVDQERDILRRAMERAGGNTTRAAKALGLKRTTLVDKLKRHALDDSGVDTKH